MDFAHTLCQSCDAAEVLLIDTENRHRLSSVRADIKLHYLQTVRLVMERKSNLRRTQSLRSVPLSTSVSQLVARYQTKVEVNSTTQSTQSTQPSNNEEAKPKQVLTETSPNHVESKETLLEGLMRRNEREQSPAKTNLRRSKSMGSLQNSTGSIEALKALFESKAAMQNKAKSSFRAANTSPQAEQVKNTTKELKTKLSADASIVEAKSNTKEDHVTQKVVNHIQTERRKTIGGTDFENIAVSPTEENRRLTADSRDSSFSHTEEKLCVSVKAMSALYLSKVASQETNHSHLKQAQDQPSESEKKVKLSKMAEDSEQWKDDHPPPPSVEHKSDISGEHFQQSMPSQLSKERLYEQRQKCELRRLLKHTHPELKMLDEVVDEELAEVLSSEAGVTAGETGYEGEVLSRRLIFENCAFSDRASAYTSEMHMTEGKVRRGDAFEEHKEKPCIEGFSGIVDDKTSNREFENEILKIDVRATRRMFESQSVNTSRPNFDELKGKCSICGDEESPKQKLESEMSGKDNLHSGYKSSDTDATEQPCKQVSCVHVTSQSTDHEFSDREEVSTVQTVFEDNSTSLLGPERFEEIIKTSADLFKNNPFISTNIEIEKSYVNTSTSQIPANPSGAAEDYVITNVKNRAHLFESMPFDKIRQQNNDEIETMVENIKETLNSLYSGNAIHSDGVIIEVNETMIAKKAKFTLSVTGPKIKYDDVAEGGAQNFILQLLPRANLKPLITYLKEDSKGNMEVTKVSVPLHHHQFTTSQDTQFKTANTVQLVEDILNQDNSLRKGVIIQEDATSCAEVIVYSLYNYFDEEDVKRYCPPQGNAAEYEEPEKDRSDIGKTENQSMRKGTIKSVIGCFTETLQEQPSCPGSIRPDVTVKGNVKLFKSCIDKGDFEYLKTLQSVPAVQEQELPSNQTAGTEFLQEWKGNQAEDSPAEWVPVDIKKLKSMFSGDQTHEFTGQNVPLGKSQSSAKSHTAAFSHEQVKNIVREGRNFTSPSYLHLAAQNEDMVHQAELVQTVDDNNEISNLQIAIHNLQQSTAMVKSLHDSSQAKQKFQICSEEDVVSVTADNVKHSARLLQENEDQKEDSFTKPCCDEPLPTLNITTKSDHQYENTETVHEDTKQQVQTSKKGKNSMERKADSSETTPEQQEEEEVVFQGKLQAALESLERSNINVTRGDFRAAMIYRNSTKPHKDRSQNVNVASGQDSTMEALCPVTEPKSTEEPMRQELSKEEVTATDGEPQSKSEILDKPGVSSKSKRPAGPKPAIPPKPEHLKQTNIISQLTKSKDPEGTQTNSVRSKKKELLVESYKNENRKDPFKINIGAHYEGNAMSQEGQVRHQVQSLFMTLESDNTDKNTFNQPEAKDVTAEEKGPQDFPVKENKTQTNDSHADFHDACQNFRGKKCRKNPPVKPKRVKVAQPDILAHVDPKPQQAGPSCSNSNTCGQTADSNDKHEKEMKQESKVEMREKKGRTETEDERRQRLSVHMDEIMRGNITAAMEIFDNLRKQEELQSILSRVEEIEQDTSEVDVRSVRKVYENIPDWVVSSDKKKEENVKEEHKEEKSILLKDNTESKSSMAHVFGDLERASEEIINLKEQTLARLLDIEETIKKALYSVSTLKSDADIAGLSCLFKESLGTEQESPSSGNISKISIGSSRTKSPQTQKSPASKASAALSVGKGPGTEVVSAKQRATPPSSPAFISIQSAARKTEMMPSETTTCPTCQHSSNTEEKFRTTKTLTCNSPALNRKGGQKQSTYSPFGPKQELSVLEVQTDHEGKSIIGTKTVTENYERTDNLGNRFYSTKTSTVVTTQPETVASSTSEAVISPATYQITTYPEVRLPVNQKP